MLDQERHESQSGQASELFGRALLPVSLALAAALSCSGESSEPEIVVDCSTDTLGGLYERRIAPLFAETHDSSCNECHLSGVDLKMFARSTPCETMACLVEDGMVSLEDPGDSRILSLIAQADPESPLIDRGVQEEEYTGFRQWIEIAARCPSDECAGVECTAEGQVPACDHEPELTLDELAALKEPDGCSDLALEQLFRDSVYKSRGRCFPCHFDTELEIGGDQPRFVITLGGCNPGSLATLRELERRGYLDREDPERSLLLRKPLDDDGGGVDHGGGAKFHDREDPGYLNMLRFVRHYASCR